MRLSGNTVEIAIVDHGEGITPEVLPHIFERFRQAARSPTRQHGGMGLALAIARHLLDLHGGTVNATSRGPGHGATFTVRLPMFAEVAAGSEADSVPDRDSGSRPENPLAGIHALAVDDDANALGMLTSMLELGGATVTGAGDADEALRHYGRHHDIAVLLSDIGMPGRDGYDLIESLRRDFGPRGASLAAVAVSGYARHEDHARALRAGFDAHLAKPFGMDTLFDLIVSLVESRRNGTIARDRARPGT